jgi:hypothetical protein
MAENKRFTTYTTITRVVKDSKGKNKAMPFIIIEGNLTRDIELKSGKKANYVFTSIGTNVRAEEVYERAIGKYEKDKNYNDNVKFNRKDGIMFYSTVDVIIDGKVINGVIIPENYAEELKTIYQTELKTRKETFNKVVDEIISGERLINWELVGYEYHNYQPWLRNLPKCLDRKEQDLMKAAVEKYIGEPVYGNICDYLEKKLDQGITFKENLNEKAVNVELNKDTKAREELRDEIVTHLDF